jgi:predicted nucleic acid-binding Zn ribbon protein
MGFKSVSHIIDALKIQERFEEQPIIRLQKCWADVVGNTIAAHTRPLSIERQILRVGTSSAAWSQNLTFGRQDLLLQINAFLPTPLVDIRFSTAGWKHRKNTDREKPTFSPHDHPSYLEETSDREGLVLPTVNNPNKAFQNWAEAIQKRSQHLPLCPQCECHTPPGELERWGVCSLCAGKRFAN